ncbi:MAG: hypothetical protein JWQ25_1993 [Daejeonella sp.]|nr:hypothetical protein [Daejeonella sp.]
MNFKKAKSPIFILIYAAIHLTFLTSCEGYRTAKGIVKDKATNMPLDSVLCTVTTGKMQVYTDTSGKYNVHNSMGGCVGGCKDIVVEFSKKDYKTVIRTQENASGIILLEK